MKEEILKLRSEGKTYDEIAEILNCSKGTISYHCGEGTKEKARERRRGYRKSNPILKKCESYKGRLPKKKTEKFQIRYQGGVHKYSSDLKTFAWQDAVEKLIKNPHCYLTGEPLNLEDFSNVVFDHIIPVSKGGDNSLENLGFCTPQANNSKFDLVLEDYLELCKKVLIHNGFSVIKI